MKKNSLISRMLALSLLISACMSVTGCSEFLKGIAEDRVTEYVQGFFEEFTELPERAIDLNSIRQVDFPVLTDEQNILMMEAVSGAELEISSVTVNDNRNKATVKIDINDYMTLIDPDYKVATLDDYVAAMSESSGDIEITLTAKRQDKGEWLFDDLSELVELFAEPYSELCVLDDEGLPININDAYIDMVYVDSAWYDPESGNPEGNTSVSSPVALQCAFYFNRPMNMTFTARLCLDGEVVEEQDVVLAGQVLAVCDFSHDLTDSVFRNGNYTVRLTYDGIAVAESDSMLVTR